ncbi:extracellular calcium-sensing receptor-like [Pleurodeles waltl]|uniref:extracellular calcium-sensing receptor-like n=1 Tax=Pleurodeles waltl TaxID=8319 RepID=UPI0037096974
MSPPTRFCSAYRPISLLNTEIKILSMVLVTRLRRVLTSLIHLDQYGFMPAKSTRPCIRQLHVAPANRALLTSPLALLLMDFKNVFDTVNWSYLEEVLASAGFGPRFRALVGLLYSNPSFVFQNYLWLQALVFAIEEVNRNPDLLPNVTLGFQIYDSCADLMQSLLGTLWMMTGQERHTANYRCHISSSLAGIVGDAGSSSSILMARVLGVYRQPQISYFSTIPLLSDRNQFPSFFRTIPSDDVQFRGLAQLALQFHWTWVGLLAEDNDYGQHGIQVFQTELHKAGACVAFLEYIILSKPDRNANHIVQVIRNSTANAIIMFGLDSRIMPLLDELVKQNVTGKVFIASEAWSTSALLSVEQFRDLLSGTIGFTIYSGEMLGFAEHFNSVHPTNFSNDIYLREFWETAFRCEWQDHEVLKGSLNSQTKRCTGAERVDSVTGIYNDIISPRVTFAVYRAVYAIVLALKDMYLCKPGRGPFHQRTCANIFNFQPWQCLKVKAPTGAIWLHLTSSKSKFEADRNGARLVEYLERDPGTAPHKNSPGIVVSGNYLTSSSFAKGFNFLLCQLRYTAIQRQSSFIGHYRSHALLNFYLLRDIFFKKILNLKVPVSVCSTSCIPGFRQAAKEGEPVCCFLCVPCPQGEISNQTDSVECSKCPWDQWPNSKQDRCILKLIEFLSYEDPLGTALASISFFLSAIPAAILGLFIRSRDTPIVKANNRSLSYLLLLSLTLSFLCSLAFIGFPTTGKCLIRQTAFGITFALCVSCILAKTIIVLIAFNATKPNSELKRWVGPKLSYFVVSVCTLTQCFLCACWLSVSPPFLELNIDSQPGIIIVECNEGSPVAFWCMLGYLGLLASISFIMAFLARKLPDSFNEAKFITFSMLAFISVWVSFFPAYLSTKGKYMVVMEVFAILSSVSSLVSCIFFRKCYIILLRPQMNSKEYLMGK